jgi:hypothetical protein
MKVFFFSIGIFLTLFLLVVPGPVLAGCEGLVLPNGKIVWSPVGKCELTTPGAIISAVIPLILVAAGFLLLIMLIISGYQLIFSRGDPKALEGAKGRLVFAIIGFLIVFGAYWILVIIQELFKFQVAD